METLQAILANPIVRAAFIGFVGAASADFHAFRQFQKREQIADFDWGVALFRWGVGIFTGVMSGLGFEGLNQALT